VSTAKGYISTLSPQVNYLLESRLPILGGSSDDIILPVLLAHLDGREVNLERRILSVLAHPDDESFGMGGTLAKYASEGARVQLICATRGEAGEVDQDCLDGYESIADLRIDELNCAVKALGIEQVHLLPYRDSGMTGSQDNNHTQALMNAPLEEVAKQVAVIIREFKPQVVLTFDPAGGYRHPDHIAIHQATTLGVKFAGDPMVEMDYPPYQPARLYYHTIPRHFIRFNVQLLRFLGKDPSKYGRNQDIDLTQIAEDDFPVHVIVDYSSYAARKVTASECHASQGGRGLTRRPMRLLAWLLGGRSRDQFMQAIPSLEENAKPLRKDLFAGID
jgi:LmbE family N-acetylglucosaminyl deacetylase